MQTNPAVEQKKNIKWPESPWNQSGSPPANSSPARGLGSSASSLSPIAVYPLLLYLSLYNNLPFITYLTFSVNVGCWTSQANTNVDNGRPDPASTISTCQAACLANPGCTGFDYVPANAAPQRCWLSGPWSGGRNNGTATGVTHYDINRHYCSG